MKDGPRYPLERARRVAETLRLRLAPWCERIEIVGSVRRQKPEVGDVELLYVSREVERGVANELIPAVFRWEVVEEEINRMLKEGLLDERPNKNGKRAWGEKIKLAIHRPSGIPVDLFAARAGNWWNLLVCRTGPAESNMRIAKTAKERGLKWEPYGEGLADRRTGETVWRARNEHGIFERLGLTCEAPEQRT
jgi:DNA polymerase/3'-5' exonuclease PolX